MVESRLSGKLAVILHADVAGSTALVQQDEQLAHQRIHDAFRCFSDIIGKYHGRVQELRGDALLAEFDRASDAVTAALAFQSEHYDQLGKFDDDIRPNIRVGIALGEVVIADSTVTGAGVVLAQRVEQLAEPGGLCITSAIHEALPNRMPFSIESIGEQALKGFDDHVRVYRVQLSKGEPVPEPQKKIQRQVSPKSWRQRVAIAVVVLLVVVGIGYWSKRSLPQEEPASIERMAFPLPDKPSIAVLPFTNMSDDAEQEYFTDGMTENLITDLSKISGLFVIARNSSFSYKGQQVKVRQVAEDLGVRYVMEGSVQRAGDQVRINAQLIDATTGGHLWAERYDGSLQDIFALQDQVTQKIIDALKVSLTGEEEAQQTRHATNNAEAHDAFLQGWAHYKLEKPADLARGIPYFEEAIRLDPNYGQAHAVLASIFWDAYVNDWAFDLDMPSFRAEERANEHLEQAFKAPSSLAHAQQARVYLSMGFPGVAVEEAEKAVALDGNDATALAALANALVVAGRLQDGADAIRKAMRLDPHHPPNYLAILGAAEFGLERFEEAAKIFERALKRNPDNEKALIYLASSYGHLDRMREAEDTIEMANDLRATFGLGALTLEKDVRDDWNIFNGEIDFPSFGPKQAQELLRAGLSNIPALTWQYLVRVHFGLGAGNTWVEIKGATEIDLATAKSFYDRRELFIDVGTEDEGLWQEGHIPGAVNLPGVGASSDKKRFRETTLGEVADKSKAVVFYWCKPDRTICVPYINIAKAVNWGYQKVYYFDGGAPAWKEAGYPIETVEK